jgi:phage/conjugal plasmid C-4 type zinc finger TraR family protein
MAVSTDKRYKALAERLAAELAETEESIARIDRDVNALTQDMEDEGGIPTTHPADEGSDVGEIERAQTFRVDLEARAEQIRVAQQRMADGAYGICSNCGKQIPIERLEALPHATLCIDCQALSEQ